VQGVQEVEMAQNPSGQNRCRSCGKSFGSEKELRQHEQHCSGAQR